MAQKWAIMLGASVSCPGRVFGDALTILGLLQGVCAILSQWPFLDSNNSHFQTPAAITEYLKKLKLP